MARVLRTLLAIAAFYLLLNSLTLAAFKGKDRPMSFIQPAQPAYDPECVSPPPAEIASLSLEKGPRICPLSEGSTCYTAFRLKMAVSALERGPFTAGWLAYYSGTPEWVWCSPWFSGPGIVHLNATSDRVRDGYRSFGFPLFVSKDGGTVWVQSIDIYGLEYANVKCLCLPNIKDVTIEEHKDLGGIVIHVFLNVPMSWSTFRVRVYWSGKLVYDFMKSVSIPEKWEHSDVTLRVDFGPIRLKKAGTYTIQVDVTSNGTSDSRTITYVKPSEPESPAGRVTVNVEDPCDASWRVTWSGGASGSREGKGSDAWSFQAASSVSLRAEILSNPRGYLCSITPSFATAEPGESVSFTVNCEEEAPPPKPSGQPQQDGQQGTPQIRQEQSLLHVLLALSIALSAAALTALVVVLAFLLKRGRAG